MAVSEYKSTLLDTSAMDFVVLTSLEGDSWGALFAAAFEPRACELRHGQAYAGYTVCAPSRTTFFTGRHSGHFCALQLNGEELKPEPQMAPELGGDMGRR